MGTTEIGTLVLGIATGAAVAAPIALLAARGRGAADRTRADALEGQLATERETRAKETERLEALRVGLEAQVRDHAAAAARAQAVETAATGRVADLVRERDEARSRHGAAQESIQGREVELALANGRVLQADETLAALKAGHARELAARDAQIAEGKSYIEKCDEILKKAFDDATAKALNDAMRDFDVRAQARFKEEQERAGERSTREKEEIERLLQPMQKELKELEEMNVRLEESRVKAEGALDVRLDRIQQTSESLANALRKPGVRGTWGEEQLKRILDSAGMTEGVHYRVQDHTEEEGEALRTDFIIMLPKGREVVIDSKAPLLQYEAAMNAATDEERVRCGEGHARAVRGHFRALKGKEYWRRYPGSPDCVILFIPYEGAYQMACEHDKSLLTDCHAQKVILANPMTLMGLVHVAAYALQEDRMKGDIEQVRVAATTLCERLGRVFTLIARHRGHLTSAVESYNGVVASIEGRLVPSTKAMERLGLGDARMATLPTVLQASVRILPVAEIDEDAGSEGLFAPSSLT